MKTDDVHGDPLADAVVTVTEFDEPSKAPVSEAFRVVPLETVVTEADVGNVRQVPPDAGGAGFGPLPVLVETAVGAVGFEVLDDLPEHAIATITVPTTNARALRPVNRIMTENIIQ